MSIFQLSTQMPLHPLPEHPAMLSSAHPSTNWVLLEPAWPLVHHLHLHRAAFSIPVQMLAMHVLVGQPRECPSFSLAFHRLFVPAFQVSLNCLSVSYLIFYLIRSLSSEKINGLFDFSSTRGSNTLNSVILQIPFAGTESKTACPLRQAVHLIPSSSLLLTHFSLLITNYGVGVTAGLAGTVVDLAAASAAVLGMPALIHRSSISMYCWLSSLVGGICRMVLPVLGSLVS